MGKRMVSFICRTPSRKKAPVVVFTDPIYMVWFLIEEQLSVRYTHPTFLSSACLATLTVLLSFYVPVSISRNPTVLGVFWD